MILCNLGKGSIQTNDQQIVVGSRRAGPTSLPLV